MPSISLPAALGLSAGAGLIGSGLQAGAASSAAGQESAAAQQASANQLQMFQQIQQNLQPYMGYGTQAGGALSSDLFGGGSLTQPQSPTTTASNVFGANPSIVAGGGLPSTYQPWGTGAAAEQDLQDTPGYQFTLQQGLKSLGNSYAARGLGISGAGTKGAETYASGLADQTFNQQLQNNLTQQNQQYSQGLTNQSTGFSQALQGNAQTLAGQNQLFSQSLTGQNTLYNWLSGLLNTGLGAATGTGQFGTQATQASNNYLTSGASAGAAGTVGAASALSGGLGSGGNSAMQYYLLNNLFGGGSTPAAMTAPSTL